RDIARVNIAVYADAMLSMIAARTPVVAQVEFSSIDQAHIVIPKVSIKVGVRKLIKIVISNQGKIGQGRCCTIVVPRMRSRLANQRVRSRGAQLIKTVDDDENLEHPFTR